MQNTFFTLPGVQKPCQTTRGTRPGDPVADVLFNLCMRLVLQDFHTWMQKNSDVPWLGHPSPVTDFSSADPLPAEGYIDVTFVNDCAVLLHAGSNDRILHLS